MFCEVEIFDVSYEGAGVGKVDGQIVFVPKTLPGERVEIEIIKKSGSFLLGRAVKILQKSEKRKTPFCQYFDLCGGCAFQHCEYEDEIYLKKQILEKELRKIGWYGVVNFVMSSSRFFYRNKVKLEVENGRLGYFKLKSHDFVEIENCPIVSKKINKTFSIIKEFIEENKFENLQNVYVKEVDEKIAICFLFDKKVKKMQKNLKNMQIFGKFLVFFAFGDVLESDKTEIVQVNGKGSLSQNFGDFVADFEVSAFNQVNDEIAKKLYDFVLDVVPEKIVVNAYSGQGVLTRLMTKKAKFVYGVEVQSSACKSAEKIANSKMKNICAPVENVLGQILRTSPVDVIVLDPAREGCKKTVLEEILKNALAQVVYVSCNFATLVRDLKILSKSYDIESVTAFDMFSCTASIETVVVLKLKT